MRKILEARLPKIHANVVVFNGHIHNYERFERQGVEYVVTGGGGADPYPVLFRGAGDLYRDTGFPVYHYLVLDVANHKLHAVMWKVKDPDAGTLEVGDEGRVHHDAGRTRVLRTERARHQAARHSSRDCTKIVRPRFTGRRQHSQKQNPGHPTCASTTL